MILPKIQNKTNVTFLTFILFATIYVFFFVLLRYDLKPTVAIYWISSISLILVILWQIFNLKNKEKLILFEIIILTFLFHTESIITCVFGLYGDDPAKYFYVMKGIIAYGIPLSPSVFTVPPYDAVDPYSSIFSYYPTLVLVGVAANLISGLDLEIITNWLPSIWSSIGIIGIYLISNSLFDNKRAGLLATLSFSSFYMFITGHSQFYRESIGFTLFLFAIFAFLAVYHKNRNSFPFIIICILLTTSIVFTHYLISIIWIILIVFWFISYNMIEELSKRNIIPLSATDLKKRSSQVFIILSIVITFSYWIYIENKVFYEIFNMLIPSYVRYGELGIHTFAQNELKSEIIRYLSWFTTITFAAIIGYEILKRKKSKYIKEYSIIGFWAFFGFLFSQIAASASGKLYYGRIPVFIYPFALIAVTYSILKFKKYQLKKILICVLIIFMTLQLFRVDFIPINPYGAVETYSIKSNEIYGIQNGPQDMQGIRAALWFGTDKNSKLNFTTQITVNGKNYWVEPYGEYRVYYISPNIAINKRPYLKEYANRLYSAQWYTSTNHIIDLNTYFNENLVYDNGKSKIWSTRT